MTYTQGYFFVLKRNRYIIKSCDIGSIDLYDHAPLSCTIHISDNPGRTLEDIQAS